MHEVAIPISTVHQLLVDAAASIQIEPPCGWCCVTCLGCACRRELTYDELDRQSDRFAAALSQSGIRKGSRISIMLPNIPQQVVAYFGVLKAARSSSTPTRTYPPHESTPLLSSAEAEAVVTLSGLYDRVREIQPQTAIKQIILTDIPDTIGWPFRNSVAKQVRASGMMQTVTPQAGVHFLKDLPGYSPGHAARGGLDSSRRHGSFPVYRRDIGSAQGCRADPPQPGGERRRRPAPGCPRCDRARRSSLGSASLSCLWHDRRHADVHQSWRRTGSDARPAQHAPDLADH